jgi:hypothetical protein
MDGPMGFIQRFFGKRGFEQITSSDLKEFISKRVEEGLNLEYKDVRILQKTDDVAKGISSFANSDGGLLVVGVSEIKDRNRRYPGEITWDDDPKHDREWFEATVLNKVRPIIKGTRVVPVHSEEGTIFLVDIPQSLTPPHMAPDGRYYFRRNFSNMSMEHYQVADSFGKRARPMLVPKVRVQGYNDKTGTFQLSVSIVNEGFILAKWPFHQLRIIGCEHIEKETSSFWEHVIHHTGEDGMREEVIQTESPIQVIHAGMVHPTRILTFSFDGSMVFGKIILAAEQAKTQNFVFILTRDWLTKRTAEESTEEEIDIPVIGRDDTDDLPEDLTITIKDCFEGLSEEEGERYANRFVWDFLMHPSMVETISRSHREKNVESDSKMN